MKVVIDLSSSEDQEMVKRWLTECLAESFLTLCEVLGDTDDLDDFSEVEQVGSSANCSTDIDMDKSGVGLELIMQVQGLSRQVTNLKTSIDYMSQQFTAIEKMSKRLDDNAE